MTRLLILFSVLVAMLAAPLAAQSTGSFIKRNSDAPNDIHSNDPKAAEKAANFFAQCTAELRGSFAHDILAMPYLDKAQTKKIKSTVRGPEECMDRVGFLLKMDDPIFLGGMAEYYIAHIYRSFDLAILSERHSTPRNTPEIFSQCVVRKNPQLVRNFVTAEPASKGETAALKLVVPMLGQCIPIGEKISLDRVALRAMLSVGMYREMDAYSTEKREPEAQN